MPYVKVDDGFPEHPKAIDLSLAAVGLWLHGLCYANRHLTDGALSAGVVRRAGGSDALVAELVAAGLWEPTEHGWQMHDYDDWQTTKAEVEARRQQNAAIGRLGGLAKAKQKASTALAGSKRDDKRKSSRNRSRNRNRNRRRNRRRKRRNARKRAGCAGRRRQSAVRLA
jgi:hypothetical protein